MLTLPSGSVVTTVTKFIEDCIELLDSLEAVEVRVEDDEIDVLLCDEDVDEDEVCEGDDESESEELVLDELWLGLNELESGLVLDCDEVVDDEVEVGDVDDGGAEVGGVESGDEVGEELVSFIVSL